MHGAASVNPWPLFRPLKFRSAEALKRFGYLLPYSMPSFGLPSAFMVASAAYDLMLFGAVMDENVAVKESVEAEVQDSQESAGAQEIKVEPPKPSTELWPAIAHFLQAIPIELWNKGLRLLKSGLFVSKEEFPAVLAEYRNWFRSTVGHDVTEEKAERKLLSEQHRLVYLQEGKVTLEGYILACDIPNPSNHRRPFYLGSPTEAGNSLLVGDPALAAVGITVKGGAEQSLEYRVGNQNIPVSMRILRSFRNLASWYGALKEHQSEIGESLKSAAIALGKILKDAKDEDVKVRLLRPLRLEKARPNLKLWKGIEIWIGPKFGVEAIFAHAGRSLHGFLRDEISFSLGRAVRGRMGSFEFFNRKHRFLGAFQAHNKKVQLHGHAFQRWVVAYLEGDFPPLRKAEDFVWTVRPYLEEFIAAVQLSKPIQNSMVKDYLTEEASGDTVWCTERWLFVVTKQGVIKDAIARIGKNRRS